jgi:hypothetical protein
MNTKSLPAVKQDVDEVPSRFAGTAMIGSYTE